MSGSLRFDAVSEAQPGAKWQARWRRSWPAYERWFTAGGGDAGPDRADCTAALARHMPELLPIHARLTELAGGGDRAARFLAAWCPPAYLRGCSLLALPGTTAPTTTAAATTAPGTPSPAADGPVLLRNYDLSPKLNEGLLLHSAWRGRRVMGMTEFLWGLSDGINDAGLSVAMAFGGKQATAPGFGICLILRYLLETCDGVAAALKVLARVPSHMAYNLVLADASGACVGVELLAGGGFRQRPLPLATNHQRGDRPDARAIWTESHAREARLKELAPASPPAALEGFLSAPLYRHEHARGFGTLFTASYRPAQGRLSLHWRGSGWDQALDRFHEGRRVIRYADPVAEPVPEPAALPAA